MSENPTIEVSQIAQEQKELFREADQKSEYAYWRPIHYLGSKLRLIDPIREALNRLDASGGIACDLFAGSGTVSLALAGERNVVAADIQEYSRVLCDAVLSGLNGIPDLAILIDKIMSEAASISEHLKPCVQPLIELEANAIEHAFETPDLLCNIVENGSCIAGHNKTQIDARLAAAKAESERLVVELKVQNSLIATRYFGGLYFTYEQALSLDCLSLAFEKLPAELKSVAKAALLSTASTIVNSVGKQFAQPMRPRKKDGTIKLHLIKQMCRDRSISVSQTFADWIKRYLALPRTGSHRVVKGDYRIVLAQHCADVDVVYADPPYTRDHYSRFYHVLETLCLRDSPSVSATQLSGSGAKSRGVYRQDRHQSPFCIKSQAPGAFEELFKGVANLSVPLLLSYSPFVKDGHPRLLTINGIVEIANRYFDDVNITTVGGVKHNKLNQSKLELKSLDEGEVFIACR